MLPRQRSIPAGAKPRGSYTEIFSMYTHKLNKEMAKTYFGGGDVVTDGIKLTEVRVLHAEVGAVSRHLMGFLLQVCQLLAVVLHLEQHEGRVT